LERSMHTTALEGPIWARGCHRRMGHWLGERDEIALVARTRVPAELLVVDFEVGHRSAELTPPAIAP
jgi:hypothetical protein